MDTPQTDSATGRHPRPSTLGLPTRMLRLSGLSVNSCSVCQNLKTPAHAIPDEIETFSQQLRGLSASQLLPQEWKRVTVRILVAELWESADLEDCRYCLFLADCLRTMGAGPEAEVGFLRVVSLPGVPMYLEWHDEIGRQYMEVFVEQGFTGEPEVKGLAQRPEFGEGSSDPAVLGTIKEWVTRCDASHQGCSPDYGSHQADEVREDVHQRGRLRATAWMRIISRSRSRGADAGSDDDRHPVLPRRLLDLQPSFSGGPSKDVRLVDDIARLEKYIALSHCWGTSHTITTTASSVKKHKTCISWGSLPRTYQDAVLICRHLGVRYLWIDSLCIIQDDEQDWEIESAKMMQIFEDSYLTIAAALSTGDNMGILTEDPARRRYTSRPVANRQGIRIRPVHDFRSLEVGEVLASRAWTLQENYIPRRLLTFSTGVRFECLADTLCECGSGAFPDPFLAPSGEWSQLERRGFQAVTTPGVSADDLYDFWINGVVQPYNLRLLTRPTDKLPALSGLAKKFSTVLPDRYLAGVWTGDLLTQLCWSLVMPSITRDLGRSVPTWSWASVGSALTFDLIWRTDKGWTRLSLVDKWSMELKNASYNPRSDNVFGAQEKSSILLDGHAVDGVLSLKFSRPVQIKSLTKVHLLSSTFIPTGPDGDEAPVDRLNLRLDMVVEESMCITGDMTPSLVLNRCPGPKAWDAQSEVCGRVTFLLAAEHLGSRAGTRRRYFLLLGRLAGFEDHEHEVYERLGLFEATTHVVDARSSDFWFREDFPRKRVLVV